MYAENCSFWSRKYILLYSSLEMYAKTVYFDMENCIVSYKCKSFLVYHAIDWNSENSTVWLKYSGSLVYYFEFIGTIITSVAVLKEHSYHV